MAKLRNCRVRVTIEVSESANYDSKTLAAATVETRADIRPADLVAELKDRVDSAHQLAEIRLSRAAARILEAEQQQNDEDREALGV